MLTLGSEAKDDIALWWNRYCSNFHARELWSILLSRACTAWLVTLSGAVVPAFTRAVTGSRAAPV